jgi:hypothetical protein
MTGMSSAARRVRKGMRHPLCALCEGLDQCRILDCQEVIPEGHALCRHCEAALADDFSPDGPHAPFYRTPEPWGRPYD